MASCAACDSTIFLGGVRDGDARYCNGRCHEAGPISQVARRLDEASVAREAQLLREGPCGDCGRADRPVDLRQSYRAVSFILMTRWSSYPELSCRRCHWKALAKNSALTLLLGWWGFPWGLLATPIQLLRNLRAAIVGRESNTPSPALRNYARVRLAQHEVSSAAVHVESHATRPSPG